MKRWAVITVGLYLLALLALTVPAFMAAFSWGREPMGLQDMPLLLREVGYWAWIGVAVAGQALLLIVPVTKIAGRPVKRRHLLISTITSAFILGFMCVDLIMTVGFVIWGNAGLKVFKMFGREDYQSLLDTIIWIVVISTVWAFVFWRFLKTAAPPTATSWLMRWLRAGSILVLLVAIPSHVVVRNRYNSWDAFWGIATGITVMLLSFGPGVFFLFVKRAQQLRPRSESHV